MSVLDELRTRVMLLYNKWETEGDDFAAGQRSALNSCLAALDAFEAAHPGLKDDTIVCAQCGLAADPRGAHFRSRRGASGWPETYFLCPTCAKEATE